MTNTEADASADATKDDVRIDGEADEGPLSPEAKAKHAANEPPEAD